MARAAGVERGESVGSTSALPLPARPFPTQATHTAAKPVDVHDLSKEPRCFWALLATPEEGAPKHAAPYFVYVDPTAQQHLGTAASRLVHRPLTEFVREKERSHAEEDVARILESRTLFGSVTRCAFATLPSMRRTLLSEDPPKPAYAPTDIVLNMVGERLALGFFHVIQDTDAPAASCCGQVQEPFDAKQAQQLWDVLYAELRPSTQAARVRYVFQILASGVDRQILFSWPLPGPPAEASEGAAYPANEFAGLVQGVAPSTTTTSCTQRFRASHTLTSLERVRSVASVLIPYGSITLACFQVGSDRPSTDTSPAIPKRPPVRARPAELPTWAAHTHAPTLPVATDAPGALLRGLGQVPTSHRGQESQDTAANQNKVCSSCGRRDSPEWRRGPTGHKTLCNACGLRYARSLSNKRRRTRDGMVVTVEATGNPSTVPPSRGSGGGSRPGLHRRPHKGSDPLEEAVPNASTQGERLASVLASLPSQAHGALPPHLPLLPTYAGPEHALSAGSYAMAPGHAPMIGAQDTLPLAPDYAAAAVAAVAAATAAEHALQPTPPAPTPADAALPASRGGSLQSLLSNLPLPPPESLPPMSPQVKADWPVPMEIPAGGKVHTDLRATLPMHAMNVATRVTPTDASIATVVPPLAPAPYAATLPGMASRTPQE